jgi:hypothetical protein
VAGLPVLFPPPPPRCGGGAGDPAERLSDGATRSELTG